MRRGHKWAAPSAWVGFVGVVLAGCGLSGASAPSTTVDPEFLKGREMVEIYEMGPREDFDPLVLTQLWTEVFGMQDRLRTEASALGYEPEELGHPLFLKDGRVQPHRGNVVERILDVGGERLGLVKVGLETGSIVYFSEQHLQDPTCSLCAPVSISEDEALATAKRLFAESGTVDDDMEWEVTTAESHTYKSDYLEVRVDGWRTIDGERFDTLSNFEMRFGDGAQVLDAVAQAYWPIPVKSVGLLSLDEALAQESGEPSGIVLDGVEDPEAVLLWTSYTPPASYDSWAIPHYRVKWGKFEASTTDVLAVRRQDLPSGPTIDKHLVDPN